MHTYFCHVNQEVPHQLWMSKVHPSRYISLPEVYLKTCTGVLVDSLAAYEPMTYCLEKLIPASLRTSWTSSLKRPIYLYSDDNVIMSQYVYMCMCMYIHIYIYMTTRYSCVCLIYPTHCAIENWSKLSRPKTWPPSCS